MIPDNEPSGVDIAIRVRDSGALIVTDVNVEIVRLIHPYDRDIFIWLIGPKGKKVILSERLGESGDNFLHTVFDDQAQLSIAQGSPPFKGPWRPDDRRPGNSLRLLNGIKANGPWILRVADWEAGDTGTLYEWKLRLCRNVP